ncbi:MAG: hypothetical protein WA885_13840 [Phormidesmis sp.]
MTNHFIRRLRLLGLGVLCAVLIAGLWQTAVFAKSPAQIRVGQFIADTELTVQFQPQSDKADAVTLSNLRYKQISDEQSLPTGRYIVTVRSKDQILLRSTYGLATGDRYTLLLYGIRSEQTAMNPHTFMAQLKHILGGVDTHTANGYLPQMRVLSDQLIMLSTAPQIRLMHLAPGVVPLEVTLQASGKSLLSKTLTYAGSNQVTAVDNKDVVLAVSPHAQASTVASSLLTLQPQTLTDIFVVGGLADSQPVEIIVADSQKNAT